MLLKQNLGNLISIGGSPPEVKDLSWSLYNYNGLYPKRRFQGLKDLGRPEIFQYFFISDERYIEARTKCFVFNGQNYDTALKNARAEIDNIKQETFINRNSIIEIDVAEIEC